MEVKFTNRKGANNMSIRKSIKVTIYITLTMLTLAMLIVLINLNSFVESYQNGFYPMQTTLQTISAQLGNIAWNIIHLESIL